jgi:hypothetical protein
VAAHGAPQARQGQQRRHGLGAEGGRGGEGGGGAGRRSSRPAPPLYQIVVYVVAGVARVSHDLQYVEQRPALGDPIDYGVDQGAEALDGGSVQLSLGGAGLRQLGEAGARSHDFVRGLIQQILGDAGDQRMAVLVEAGETVDRGL